MSIAEKARILREVLNDSELTLLQIQTATSDNIELRQAIALALHMSSSGVADSITTH
jgi:hypothetical protein